MNTFTNDSYDQYADQLLNSAFHNARQSNHALLTNNDQPLILNRLLQDQARFSPVSSLYPNTMNEWILLYQLQQQKELLERQKQIQTSTTPFPTNDTHSTCVETPLEQTEQDNINKNTQKTDERSLANDEKKKIPRVPVQKEQVTTATTTTTGHQEQDIIINDHSTLNDTIANPLESISRNYASTHNKQLNTKKNFLYKSWSTSGFRHNKKKPITLESSQNDTTHNLGYKKTEKTKSTLERKPSFWRPRKEKFKKQQGDHEEIVTTIDDKETKAALTKNRSNKSFASPARKIRTPTVKKPAVVVQPRGQKMSSVKKGGTIKANTKRQMAFKSPTVKKKSDKVKNKKSSKSVQNPTMYYMPQQQQPMFYYPQQPVNNAIMPSSFTNSVPIFGHNPFPIQQEQKIATASNKNTSSKRSTTILNPRETSNDKCLIM
ncbi:uncharacterized protein BX663DRAFT_495761 [Cokeromyces recurvatus]|uniref:uncharacterized protein n=1 Tax=Cokeromyces recurvatus TaxID=90255 RepID=UPI00221E38E8|nr:uncharacterized protein BX663DRAFT_495761 [Cokeromyces recurvatus]KAI7907395.1 hypothetical protein BX663DRAFT_495761 [Cokeromyces recurvatus]